MNWPVRRLKLAHLDEASRVLRTAYDTALPWLAGRYTATQDLQFVRGVLYPAGPIWGAFAGHALAGFVALRPGWIDQLHVRPEYQQRGCGSALLRRVLDAREPVELWTFQRNLAARRFYEARGFRSIELTDGERNDEHEPDVRYRWEAVVGGDGFEPPALSV